TRRSSDLLRAFAREIEAGSDDCLTRGDVLMRGNGRVRRVHQCANFVAHLSGEHPPTLFPGTNSARRPGFGVVVHGVVNTARHSAQRVTNQVSGAVEDGKLWAVMQQV